MKAVMISIHPKWCTLIEEGKKTVEVRKTRPKLETPFKVYIYCTKPYTGSTEDRFYIYLPPHDTPKQVNGTVIGEFICDAIFPVSCYYSDTAAKGIHSEQPYTCMTDKEMIDYLGNGVEGYGWHISKLVLYPKPRAVSDFMRPRTSKQTERDVAAAVLTQGLARRPHLKRPPQSWCYVERMWGYESEFF